MVKHTIKKIGIITLYDELNIGNKLQNYAVQVLMRHYSPVVETFTYKEAAKISPLLGWKGKIVLKLGWPKRVAKKKRAIVNRWKRFSDFSREYISTTRSRAFVDFDKDLNKDYDFFVVGSDQVWHNFTNTAEELDYFFLRFAEKEKRVCLAPSFGRNNIPGEFIQKYIEGLLGFNLLSCREKRGCVLIKDLIGAEVEQLSDPTVALSGEEWSEIEKRPEYDIPPNYILVYFIGGKTKEQINLIKYISQTKNLPIIDVLNEDEFEYFVTRPDEFVYLIKRADLVCTNSFHGCIFSIIYKRRFRVFQRTDMDGTEMRSRFDGLKNIYALQETEDGYYYPSEKTDLVLSKMKLSIYNYLNRSFHLD